MTSGNNLSYTQKRLLSLDVMRGGIMILLAAEGAGVYNSLAAFKLQGWAGALVNQFFHHEWNGLRFWDLVQPGFMFIAGVALYISYFQKTLKGISWRQNFKHVAIRSLKLFLFGAGLHCIYNGALVWELWNVLTQLAFTIMISYLIIRKSYLYQILFSVALLILYEVLYKTTNLPGYDHPFIKDENFGSWADMLTMGKLNPGGGWVFINFISTAAHTIWGAIAGKLLISNTTDKKKITVILLSGVIALALGFLLDILNITPIIKRIATTSFVLVSGGWVLMLIAFLYWLTDSKKYQKYAWVFSVVGINSIFIYLFFETVGAQWMNHTIGIFVGGGLKQMGASYNWQQFLTALVSWFTLWCLCYWLYKKKIFFRL